MALNLLRVPVVAVFMPIFWICVLPNTVLGQFPRLDEIDGKKDTPSTLLFQERTEPSAVVFEERASGPLVRFFRDAEWYFSWGYSREGWAPTNIHISQPSLGNDFTVYDVHGVDSPTWTSIFGAQYNIRLGGFIDDARTLAVEFNMDHTKYTSSTGQVARIAGTIAGQPTDGNFRLGEPFFAYNLHNGANHVMVNLVKRVPLIGETNESFSVAGIAKIGVGAMVPHAENAIFTNYSDVGKKTFSNMIGFNRGWWRIDGPTTGVEAGFRMVLWKPIYLELTDKVAYARLGDVPVFQGTARHNLWMNEVILSVGISFGGGR